MGYFVKITHGTYCVVARISEYDNRKFCILKANADKDGEKPEIELLFRNEDG